MVLDSLGSAFRSLLRRVAGAASVDEAFVKELVRDIQRALLQSDVAVPLALKLSKAVERRALQEKPPAGMGVRTHVVRIIYEELVGLLGKPKEMPPTARRLLLVGLYGQGKTTTAAKLARWLQKRGRRVGLVQADTHRPAAYDQLKQLAESLNVPFYGDPAEKDAVKVAQRGLRALAGQEVVIVDSSGRHALEDDLIREIEAVAAAVQPDERLLVLDATTGQQAGPQAAAFHEAVQVTGVIVSKLDGSAKGGGALSAVAATGAPVVFVGVGEKVEDLERFDPPRFISRLLGMGDVQALLEVAEDVDEAAAEETAKKIMSGRFTLVEFYEQLKMVVRPGVFRKLLGALPGMPHMSDEQLEDTAKRLRKYKVILDSMTREEKENPRLIKGSRIQRVARGSGTRPEDVRELLKQYQQSLNAVKQFAGNRKLRRQLTKQMKAAGVDME